MQFSSGAMAIGLVPEVLIVTIVLFGGLSSVRGLVTGSTIGIALIIFLWAGFKRGTYITIDNGYLWNTFLFLKRDVIPISNIISLSTQRPLLLSGKITRVWSTYIDGNGRRVTKTLTNKESLSKSDLRDLIDTIHKANPKVEINQELLQ